MLVLGLKRERGPFFKFLRCSNDFIIQKVYCSRLKRVYIGLIMCVSCLFLSFLLITSGVLIKVDWLAACIALRVVGAVMVVFLWRGRKICIILQTVGSKG
jgi:hypothetical protein